MSYVPCRTFMTSCASYGKKNFRKFLLYGKRGPREYKAKRRPDPEMEKLTDRGVRPISLGEGKEKRVIIPEMVPELIVPDLEGFMLKPYVSYRVPEVVQNEFKPQDLFYAVYSNKIAEDFKTGKLDEEGNPLEPSEEELLSAEIAKNRASSICADKFSEVTWNRNIEEN